MEREYIRTCSACQASALAASAGRTVRIGRSLVRIHQPTGRYPIDPDSDTRYVARVEQLDAEPLPGGTAHRSAVEVVASLFGIYLDESVARSPTDARPSSRAPAAA